MILRDFEMDFVEFLAVGDRLFTDKRITKPLNCLIGTVKNKGLENTGLGKCRLASWLEDARRTTFIKCSPYLG